MIYLDHNATTPVDPAVLDAMEPFWRGQFANPSSGSILARPVKRAIAQAREECAALLGCPPEDLIFTSGGTESLNAALHSVTCQQPSRRHLIVGSTEHEAVLNPVASLEKHGGYTVTRLPVDGDGVISLSSLAAAIRPDETAAVVLMLANNETGVIQPIAEAAALIAPFGLPFLCDAVQAAGKVPLRLADSGVTYAAFSGHKFNAPKGIGLLYVRTDAPFRSWFLGGTQENRRRAGTENVAAIVGLGAAARLARETPASAARLADLRDHFEAEVLRRIPGSHRNVLAAPRVPNTTSLRFDGTGAEGLLFLLDQRGVCASAGSACTTGSLHPSHVLTAMGLDAPSARSTLRFSFGKTNTPAEIETALTALEQSVAKFRALMP